METLIVSLVSLILVSHGALWYKVGRLESHVKALNHRLEEE